MLSGKKLLPTKNKTIDEDDYPNTRILDTYNLDFLDLPTPEKSLKELERENKNITIS